MYLKRLELQGFKSFPEKIKLEFNKGITAVVGPNGSGKSNVADAVRWVLGEQSAKSLRGAKMEDVIFAGTQNRRPLNFAEVCMIIDNSDFEMESEFSEITVARRVYRSGESQYLLNGVSCRLKDITELFMDTGVGREGYSVIGQGRIEEILSAKSEERRLLFEEAAGIVKYKNRKTEAEAKLERERQNLVRVNDIVSELELQITPLSEQAETAKQYLALAERQKLLNVNMFLLETQNVQSALDKITKNIENVKFQIGDISEQSSESKAKTALLKNNISEVSEQIEQSNLKVNEINLSVEKCENQIKLCRQSGEHMGGDAERLRREIEKKNNAIQTAGEAKKAYEQKQSDILLEQAAHNEDLKARQDELNEIDEQLRESERLVEQYNADHIEYIRSTTDIRERISRAETMYEQFEARKEELDDDRDDVREKLEQAKNTFEYLKDDLSKKDAQISYLSKQIEDLFEEKYIMQQEIIDDKAELDKTENAHSAAVSRHKLLCELEQSYEGYFKSVKSVLLAKNDDPLKFSGIRGAVADLLTLESTYETAVEIALGGALQNIVTGNEKDAQSAIEYLKSRKDGRATFLPLSAVKGKELSNKAQLLNETGVIGVAKELISYEPVYEGIFSSLLGRALVVDNLNNAVALAKKYKHELKIVTLEGDLLSPGGSLTGGSVNKTTASILSRAGEIVKLKEKIDRLAGQREEQAGRLAKKNDKLSGISDLIEKNKALVQEVELSKANVSANLQQTEQTISSLNARNDDITAEENRLMEQIVEMNRQKRHLHEEQQALEAEISGILEVMDRMQKTANDYKLAKDKKMRELTHIQAGISGLNENLSGIKENVDRLINEIKTAESDIESFENEIKGISVKQEELKKEIENYRLEIETLTDEREKTQVNISDLQGNKSGLQQQLDDCEQETVEKIELVSKLNSELTRLELNREQREIDSRKWFDLMWDEYGLTHQAALKLPRLEGSMTSLQKEEREVKNVIRALGSVNVNAIEEYKAVKERYEFLCRQRDDILSAEEKLLDIIKELEILMERQFTEQFEVISQNFGIVFAEMFGGGTAYLKLSDEDDILNSGIEIIAQPPGKRLQNMNLFSGGERALTATALLFGILRMKPSPFCILDEVEAALDDANVRRYANYLRNFAHKTQFIIITHRKGTMEAADVLYGVTMQEQGISKMVSVKFGDD